MVETLFNKTMDLNSKDGLWRKVFVRSYLICWNKQLFMQCDIAWNMTHFFLFTYIQLQLSNDCW
jgi:hypothetical protein